MVVYDKTRSFEIYSNHFQVKLETTLQFNSWIHSFQAHLYFEISQYLWVRFRVRFRVRVRLRVKFRVRAGAKAMASVNVRLGLGLGLGDRKSVV